MIRVKIISLMLLCNIVLTATIYFVSNFVILDSYTKIESSLVEKNIIRVEGALKNYSTALNIKLRDWAQWDDTYAFVQDKNEEYKDSNLRTTTLINLEINLILFLNEHNEIVFSRAVLLPVDEEVESGRIASLLSSKSQLVTHNDEDSSLGGIVANGSNLLLVQSLPIVQSSGEGPIKGTMMFARFLEEDMTGALENLTQLSIDLFIYNDSKLPEDVRNAKQHLSAENPHVIEPLTQQEIAGYTLLHDIDGKPAAIARIVMPRDIYIQGKESVLFFFTIAGSAIFLFSALTILMIEFFLIARFERLTKEVSQINSQSNLATARVRRQGKDEIGMLAAKINIMLSELFEAHKTEEEALRLKGQAGEDLQKHLQETENMNKLMVGRELKMIELKDEIESLKQKLASKD